MVFLVRQNTRYMQYVAAFIVGLLEISVSLEMTWTSPSLPLLLSNNTPLSAPLTDTEETWLVSVDKLGSILGCIIASFLTDMIGRKLMLLLSAVPYVITMSVTAFTQSALVLIVVRAIGGIGTGIIISIIPVYISEVSDKDIRGRLGIVQLILATLGSVFVYSVGPFVSYVFLSLTCAIFPLVFIILFSFMPETPYYLVKKGKTECAAKNLKLLSSGNIGDDTLTLRLKEIQDYVDSDIGKKGSFTQLLFQKANRKAFIIILGIVHLGLGLLIVSVFLGLRTVLIFSGIYVWSSYLQKLIQGSGSNISPEVSSIIFGVINLPSALLAAYLIDRVGRRPLFLISSAGCAVALIVEGIYFYLKEIGKADDILWVPTTCLCAFQLLAYLGIKALPAVIQGELFSINVKSFASSLIMFYGSVTSFLLLKFFQPLADKLGMQVMFWFFGGVCVVGFVFGIFVLPETKGKTFLEIQELLGERHKKSDIQLEKKA